LTKTHIHKQAVKGKIQMHFLWHRPQGANKDVTATETRSCLVGTHILQSVISQPTLHTGYSLR